MLLLLHGMEIYKTFEYDTLLLEDGAFGFTVLVDFMFRLMVLIKCVELHSSPVSSL